MLQLAGVELYFNDVEKAKRFYCEVIGLTVLDEKSGHYARLDGGPAFVCVERKGSETYPSQDKAALFFHVASLSESIERIGRDRFVQIEAHASNGRSPWAVFHDPEGHNVLLIEQPTSK